MTAADPPASAVAWATDHLDTDAVSEARALPGSSAARVWLLGLAGGRGSAVLKLACAASAGGDERLIGREAVILRALRPFGLPVPEVLAVDASGECAGTPALLMTQAPGQLLAGQMALRASLTELAAALTHTQQQTRSLVAGRRWAPWTPAGGYAVPTWSTREALWSRAIRVVQRFQWPKCDAFIHRDPHPANVLFEGERVSAILDWPHAGRGPAGFDGARMAVNVCCLLGMDAAAAFRSAFEDAQARRHDPLLDVFAACEFLPDPALEATAQALGIGLSRNQARGRLENFLADAMRRMTSRRLS